MLRSLVHPETADAVVLRASGGPSILKDLSNEHIALDVEEALRLNASAVAVQVFIGGEHETQSVINMTDMVDACIRYGIPVLGVTAVGTQMTRDARYIGLATRILAELGATLVKTYYVDDFEQVTAACPVPIVMAGGKKLPELDALQMARDAIDRGASGVDMGRNVFQSDDPVAMIQAVRKVVHENATAQDAYDYFRELRGA